MDTYYCLSMEKFYELYHRRCWNPLKAFAHSPRSSMSKRFPLRILIASFNGNPVTNVTSCYSLTNVADEDDVLTFYDQLSSLVRAPYRNTMFKY